MFFPFYGLWISPNFLFSLQICKMGDGDCNIACLHVYRGGYFESESFFLYAEGELTEAKIYPNFVC